MVKNDPIEHLMQHSAKGMGISPEQWDKISQDQDLTSTIVQTIQEVVAQEMTAKGTKDLLGIEHNRRDQASVLQN